MRRKDGTPAVFLDSSRAVWDAAGKIIRYQGTLVDITERRKMEKATRRQEEFQRYLLESFPDLILVIDLEERYSFVSSRMRDLLGYKPRRLLGKKIEEAGRIIRRSLLALYHDVSSGEQMFGFCEYAAQPSGWHLANHACFRQPAVRCGRQISGVIVSVRDITVERKLEQQIIQSERLAAMGADDRRLRSRTEQSADQHPGRQRTVAGQARPTKPRGSN